VSVAERAEPIGADIAHKPQATVSEVVESEHPKPDPIEAEPVETNTPGLGLSLNQFKRDVPIGEAWKVLSDTPRDDGSISYQLISTVIKNVMLSVSGNPEDLREISVVFFVKTNQSDAENVARIAVMTFFLSKYSDWTKDEINEFWIRLMQVGAGDETEFKIQKNGHKFWLTPMGVQDGTMFMTGVIVDQESKASTLQQWLDDHPVPIGAGLYKSTGRSGNVGNAKFSFKGFRHKGDGTFIGEMTNESNQNLQIATFTLSVYDRNAELLDTGAIVINSFGAGQTKSFEAYVEEVSGEFFYKIDFENAF